MVTNIVTNTVDQKQTPRWTR